MRINQISKIMEQHQYIDILKKTLLDIKYVAGKNETDPAVRIEQILCIINTPPSI